MSNQSLREAAQQALGALLSAVPDRVLDDGTRDMDSYHREAIRNLRSALAQPDDKAVVPNFGLGRDQLDKLLTNSLKPDEIAGTNFVRRRRIQELVHWFVRLANGNANPKWLHEHAFEMAYYIATNVPPPPAKQGAELPNVVSTAPERIYLVIGEDCPPDADFNDIEKGMGADGVTWCADKIDDNSIEYMRADRAA